MGTLRLHYEEKNILSPIGAFFLLKLKVTKIPIQNTNKNTKSGQNRPKSKTFLVPCDSSIRGEGGFKITSRRPGNIHAHQVY